MIVITGGNGEFGRLVAGHLLDHLPAGQVTVTVREPRKAGPLKDRGADVRHADFDEPATLVRAFQGADTVLINGTNYDIDPARAAAGRGDHGSGGIRRETTRHHHLAGS